LDSNITNPVGGVGLRLGLLLRIGTGDLDLDREDDLDRFLSKDDDLERLLSRLLDRDRRLGDLGLDRLRDLDLDKDLLLLGDLLGDSDLRCGLFCGESLIKGGGGCATTGGGLGLRTTAAIFLGLSFMYFNFALKNSNSPFFSHPLLSLGLSCEGGL